jgi:hypothetical protein
MRWCDCDSRYCMHAVTIAGENVCAGLEVKAGSAGLVIAHERMYVSDQVRMSTGCDRRTATVRLL